MEKSMTWCNCQLFFCLTKAKRNGKHLAVSNKKPTNEKLPNIHRKCGESFQTKCDHYYYYHWSLGRKTDINECMRIVEEVS